MRLAVDARLMVGHPRGMGQYARALVESVRDDVTALLPAAQQTTEWDSISGGRGFYPWWEQAVLPRMTRQCRATHLLCPSNTAPVSAMPGVKRIVVVHDLIFLRPLSELPASRSPYQNLGRFYRRMVVPHAARRADVLVTVSEYTRGELAERFGIDARRIQVVPNSIGDEWFVRDPLRDQQRGRYLLTVTGEAPSKNLPTLLKAFAAMRANGIGQDLVLRVVGIKPAFHASYLAEAATLGLSGAVVFESFVAEAELRDLYRRAFAFVLPSLYEGFGIPLLEAMASGTPVACSNTTSLPEVAGTAAWMFDPRDYEEMAMAMTASVSDEPQRIARATLGLRNAEDFRRAKVSTRMKEFWGMLA